MKERLDFAFQKKIETMVRLAIMSEQKKSLKQRLDFPFQEKVETMDRLAIIQEQKIVETTVRFSI